MNTSRIVAIAMGGLSLALALGPGLAAASVTLGTANTNALSSGLIGYWPLDGADTNWTTGTTLDLSGQGYTGSFTGMSTSTSVAVGKIGQALYFNGVNSRINVPSTPTLQSFTISAWVKPQSLPSRAEIADLASLFLNLQSGKPSIYVDGVSSSYLQASALPTNTYSLVTATWDGTTLKLYTNGVLSASQSLSGTAISTCTNQESIGIESIAGGCASYNAPFQGDLDDVRLYNTALSATQIALLFAAGQADVGSVAKNALTSGLVGYWTMDGSHTHWNTGTEDDSSGSGYTGTLVNMSTSTSPVPGKMGQALNFKGAQYIDLPGLSSAINYSAITVSVWLYETGPQSGNPRFIANSHTDVDAKGFQLQLGSGAACNGGGSDVLFDVGNGTSAICASSATQLSQGKWYLLTGTYNGSNIILYVNGVQVASGTGSGAIAASLSDVNIGRNPAYAGDYFNGYIDDARIYNRALSAQEVAMLYAAGAATVGHSNPSAVGSGLVGYWTMDGPHTHWGTGIEDDSSGNGNTGHLIGMSTSTSPTQGKIGQALFFNGKSSSIDVGTNSSMSLAANGDFTISSWVNPSVTNARLSIFDKDNGCCASGEEYDYFLESNDTVVFQMSDGTTAQAYAATTHYNANAWQLFSIVYTASTKTVQFYYNGAADGTGVFTNGTPNRNNTVPATIGTWDDNYYPMYGAMDDVRVYDRALSASEIAQLYHLGH